MAMFGTAGAYPGLDQTGILGLSQGDTGILGASLKDALAYFGGRPEAATSLLPAIQQNQQMQAQRGILQSLNSDDPNVRQKAYGVAPAYGIDPSIFQKIQAAKATPALLQSMQPSQLTVPAAKVSLPGVGGAATGFDLPADPTGLTTPGMSLSDALANSKSPELQQQYAPDVIKQQMDIQAKSVVPMSADEKIANGYKATDPVYKDAYGNITSQVKPQAAVQQEFDIAANKPRTQEDIVKDRIAQQSASAAMISATKPQFVPFGAPGYMQGGKYVPFPAGGAGGDAPTKEDPSSKSITGQLGISTAAFNLATGNTAAVARGRPMQMASQELDQLAQRRGLDLSIVKPQVQAYQNNVNINTMKANALDSTAKEIIGTVQNYGPVIDKLTGNGNLRLGIKGYELVGGAVNDPDAQKAIFYLNQMRSDLAGFNAVSGGKIGVHGQVGTDNGDFAKADEVIQKGLSSGGSVALAQAVEATRQKNVAVALQQAEEAKRGIWNALGVGPNYDRVNGKAGPPAPQGVSQKPLPNVNALPQKAAAPAVRPPSVPPTWTLHVDAKGNQAFVSPDGKQFVEAK